MNVADPLERPSPAGRGPSRSTRGLLTTGFVGGWLTGSAWAIVVAFMTLAAVAGMRGGVNHFEDFIMGAAMLVLLAGLVWIGGMVCAVVGWFGLGELYASARLVAWLGVLVLVSAVMLPLLTGAMREGGVRALATIGGLAVIGFYLAQAVFWIRHGRARGAAKLALVGAFIAATSGLVLLLVLWTDPKGLEVLMLIIAFTGPTGCVLAHIGSGLAMAAERATVQALQSFD